MADNMKANQKWPPKVCSTWARILNVFQWQQVSSILSNESPKWNSSLLDIYIFWWKIQCTFRASASNAPWCHNRPLKTFGGVVRQNHTLTWSSSRTSQWMKCASPGPEAFSFTAKCFPSSSEKKSRSVQKLKFYFYRPPTKLREGNVFSCVCPSFCPGDHCPVRTFPPSALAPTPGMGHGDHHGPSPGHGTWGPPPALPPY